MAIFSPLPLLVCTQYGSPSNYLSQIGKSIYYVVGDWAWLFYKVFGLFLYLSLVGKYLSHWNVCTILKAKVVSEWNAKFWMMIIEQDSIYQPCAAFHKQLTSWPAWSRRIMLKNKMMRTVLLAYGDVKWGDRGIRNLIWRVDFFAKVIVGCEQ